MKTIAKAIADLGLKFIGFEFDSKAEIRKYLDQFPEDPAATCLENWHEYELRNKNAFMGLYLFWVQKCI